VPAYIKVMRDDDIPARGSAPEQPRAEPEIIPPRARRRPDGFSRIFVRIDERDGRERVYITRPGPFSIILGLLIIGVVVSLILIVLLGAVLIWIPIVIVAIAAAFLSGSIRQAWRRWRGA
jgi:hypothetical protein